MMPPDMLPKKWTSFKDWQDRLLASPTVHARSNTVLKVMKWISIPHHDCSPNYLGTELCGIMAIFTNWEIFHCSEWSTVSCVDDPQCNSQLLAMVTQMQHLFFFFHIICSTNSVYEHTLHHAQALTISSVLHRFQSSQAGLDCLLQTYAPHCCLQSRWTGIQVQLSCFFTALSFLSHPTFSQRCLLPTAAHDLQHFQAPI